VSLGPGVEVAGCWAVKDPLAQRPESSEAAWCTEWADCSLAGTAADALPHLQNHEIVTHKKRQINKKIKESSKLNMVNLVQSCLEYFSTYNQ
jgi:hypothetical protein